MYSFCESGFREGLYTRNRVSGSIYTAERGHLYRTPNVQLYSTIIRATLTSIKSTGIYKGKNIIYPAHYCIKVSTQYVSTAIVLYIVPACSRLET